MQNCLWIFFFKLTIVTLLESKHDCILDVIYSAVDVFLFQMKATKHHLGLAKSCSQPHSSGFTVPAILTFMGLVICFNSKAETFSSVISRT